MNNNTTSILFIDSSVDNYDFLLKGIVGDIEKVVLDSKRDGIEQITDVLAQRSGVETVHIVSHGSPGCLYLGKCELSLGNLEYYKQQLDNWCSQNLLIYGCNVAVGDAGEEFVEKLHRLTGANIAASKTKTGNAQLGGNWELEVRVGENFFVEKDIKLLFGQNTIAEYSGVFAPGDLDNTFGNGGKVFTDFGNGNIDTAYDIAIQPDGKILVVGETYRGTSDFAIARYNPDGTLDKSFGDNGKVITQISTNSDIGYELAIQADGKFVLVGTTRNGTEIDIAVARYNANGSLDNSFGNGGQVITGFENKKDDKVKTVAVQADGKIVIGGRLQSDSTRYNLDSALIRYNSDGTLDTDFGEGGKLITTGQDVIDNILIQPDGKIVAIGNSGNDFALARYNTDGSLNTSFGSGGKVRTDFGKQWDSGNYAAIQPDGKIIVVGFTGDIDRQGRLALARYNTDGSLDTSFGYKGQVVTAIGNGYAWAESIVITPGGKIIVSGTVRTNNKHDFAVVAYNRDGSLDEDFGDNGKVITVANQSRYAYRDTSMALQADGKIVIAGSSRYDNFALMRYEGVSDNLPSNKPVISDNFDSGTVNPDLWLDVEGANPHTLPPGSSGKSLYFSGFSGRSATTVQLDVANTNTISFSLAIGDGSKNGWDSPESRDKILLEYSTDSGQTWIEIDSYGFSGGQPWKKYDVIIPTVAKTTTTQFRWIQPSYSGNFDNWAIDDVVIGNVESEPNLNSAPTFTSDANLNAIEEDTTNPQGETIANLFKGKFQDSNNGDTLSGIAVVRNTADYNNEGRWQYSTDSWNWWNIFSVDDKGSAVALSANTRIRFLPDSNYNGTPPSLGVRLLDNTYSGSFSKGSYTPERIDSTNNGGTSAISASIAEIKTTINAVNDAPIVTAYQVISIPENYSNGSVFRNSCSYRCRARCSFKLANFER